MVVNDTGQWVLVDYIDMNKPDFITQLNVHLKIIGSEKLKYFRTLLTPLIYPYSENITERKI